MKSIFLHKLMALALCLAVVIPFSACVPSREDTDDGSSLPSFESGDSSWSSSASAEAPDDPGAEIDGGDYSVEYVRAVIPEGLWIEPEKDFEGLSTASDASKKASEYIEKAYSYGFNTVIIDINGSGSNIVSDYSGQGDDDLLDTIIARLRSHGMIVYVAADLFSSGASPKVSDGAISSDRLSELVSVVKSHDIDGVILDSYGCEPSGELYRQYMGSASGCGLENYRNSLVTSCVRKAVSELRAVSGSLYIGILTDSADGTVVNHSDTEKWIRRGVFSFAVIKNFNTLSGTPSFADADSFWRNTASVSGTPVYTLHSALLGSDADELTGQLTYLHENSADGSFFTPASDFTGDTTGSTESATKYIKQLVSENVSSDTLKIKTPSKSSITTYESSISISGASNPNYPLLMNGNAVERSELGYFSLKVDLSLGLNTFEFTHRGETVTLKITHKRIIIKDVSPSKDISVDGSSKLSVSVIALKESEVTASIGSDLISLSAILGNDDNLNDGTVTDYCTYSGTFTIPAGQAESVKLGQVNVIAKNGGQTSYAKGGNITVNAIEKVPDTSDSLQFGDLKLGKTGYIAESNRTQLETFDGNLNDNRSRCTNAYLPEGTMDYCSKTESTITSGSSIYKYRLLDYGKRVYSYTKVSGRVASDDFINLYYGQLPESNSLSVAGYDNNGRHSYIVLNTQWKAPFDVTLTPQKYTEPYASTPNYTVSSLTYTAVEFKFAYCATATGTINLTSDPLFSSSEWIKNSDGSSTLRLHLKKAGGLYGWGASYNEKGQLVLSFLNAYRITSDSNSYGYSLKNSVIMLDPGHGGYDFGSDGLAQSSDQYESAMNLVLANKVKTILETLGASVIMTRTTNVEVTLNARNEMVWNYKPDIFISFHRNGSESASAKGYSCFYYEPYSMPLAKEISNRCTVLLPGNRSKLLNYSPPMQVCRVSDCPSILTENWFMTNSSDFSHIISDSFNNQTADATVKGIIAYFISIG